MEIGENPPAGCAIVTVNDKVGQSSVRIINIDDNDDDDNDNDNNLLNHPGLGSSTSEGFDRPREGSGETHQEEGSSATGRGEVEESHGDQGLRLQSS